MANTSVGSDAPVTLTRRALLQLAGIALIPTRRRRHRPADVYRERYR